MTGALVPEVSNIHGRAGNPLGVDRSHDGRLTHPAGVGEQL